MLLLIISLYFTLCSSQLESFHQFSLYSIKNNITIQEYARKLGFNNFDSYFNKFKFDNNKRYGSPTEEQLRMFNFFNNIKFIDDHNNLFKTGKASHQVGINSFSDMDSQEYLQLLSMPVPQPSQLENSKGTTVFANLPQSFDWRRESKVTLIKNQGSCASCWAFTTIAMVESGYAIRYNKSVFLAEQQLVDCMKSHCKGQQISKALEYVLQNGVQYNSDYPYKAKADACKNQIDKFHAHIKGYVTMGKAGGRSPATDVEIMSALIRHGPIGFVLDASGKDFAFYRSGVLSNNVDTSKGWKAVHSMVIVGWGSVNGTNYWIAKNSWGTGWGEKGYVRLARGKSIRGMNHYLYYPEF